jgi:ribose transport system substrate-binding protein
MTSTGRWIALCLLDVSNSYQRMLWDDAKKVAPRYNHSVSVYSADRSADTQLEQIRSILDLPPNRRPTAILVNAVRESMLLGVAKEAVASGIAWAYLCRWTDSISELRRAHPKVPAFSISPNQYNVGQIQGLQLRLLLRPDDELVYIQGPNGVSTSQRRLEAARQVLNDLRGTKWSVFNSDWSREGGYDAMKSWLEIFTRGSLPHFVVAAQNDDMAVGARKAVFEWASAARSLPLDLPRFTGCDGIPSFGQRLVTEGELAATVAVPAVSGQAIDEIFAALGGGRPPSAEISIDAESFPTLDDLARKYSKLTRDKHEPSPGGKLHR